jgi:hypothetical protein
MIKQQNGGAAVQRFFPGSKEVPDLNIQKQILLEKHKQAGIIE